MSLVVDASVAVKFVTEEPGSDAAHDILVGPETLIAPDWLQVEVASALWKKVKYSRLLEIHATHALADLPLFFSRLVPTTALLTQAFDLAFRLRHPVYDCLYLALAIREDGRVVTADRDLVTAAERGGQGERVVLLNIPLSCHRRARPPRHGLIFASAGCSRRTTSWKESPSCSPPPTSPSITSPASTASGWRIARWGRRRVVRWCSSTASLRPRR